MVGFDPGIKELTTSEHGVAGACSGMLTRMIAQPLDVIKIRFQLQVEPIKTGSGSKYEGIFQACKAITKEEGLTAFWKGHIPAQMLSVVFGVTQFVTFEVLTKAAWQYLPRYFSEDLRHATHFTCGSLAGCAATVTAQPFDVLRTRFVAQGKNKIYNRLFTASVHMVRTEGPQALFKGLIPTLLQIAPQTGLQFSFYSVCTTLWKSSVNRKNSNPGGVESLVCGSASGLGAKLVVYPLDLTKKRLQIQGFQHGRQGFGRNYNYTGFLNCFSTVFKQEGTQGLYKGMSPSLIKAMITAASHFFFYEQFCQLLRLRHR